MGNEIRGTIVQGVFPGLLRKLYVGKRTGLLTFERGDERQAFRFEAGQIVNAQSTLKEDRLGETLVRLGQLSPADLKRATGVVVRDRKRLGLVLQEMNLMDQAHLEDLLSLFVREMLMKVFAWKEGSYHFRDEPLPETEDTTPKLSTGEMILEAVSQIRDPDLVRSALGDLDRVVRRTTDPIRAAQALSLSPIDEGLLAHADGRVTARALLKTVALEAPETHRSLLGLLCTGLLEYEG